MGSIFSHYQHQKIFIDDESIYDPRQSISIAKDFKQTASRDIKSLEELTTEEDQLLKSALTHPSIQKFVRSYSVGGPYESLVDFYLKANDIRHFYENKKKAESYELLEAMAQENLVVTAPKPLDIQQHFKSIILQHLDDFGHVQPFVASYAIEGVRLAQVAAFCEIKTRFWKHFCETEECQDMLKIKEVKLLIDLSKIVPRKAFTAREALQLY